MKERSEEIGCAVVPGAFLPVWVLSKKWRKWLKKVVRIFWEMKWKNFVRSWEIFGQRLKENWRKLYQFFRGNDKQFSEVINFSFLCSCKLSLKYALTGYIPLFYPFRLYINVINCMYCCVFMQNLYDFLGNNNLNWHWKLKLVISCLKSTPHSLSGRCLNCALLRPKHVHSGSSTRPIGYTKTQLC